MTPRYKYQTPKRTPEEQKRYDNFMKITSEEIKRVISPSNYKLVKDDEIKASSSSQSRPESYSGSIPWIPDTSVDELVMQASQSISSPVSSVKRKYSIETITEHWRTMWRLLKLEPTGSIFLVDSGDNKSCYIARTTDGWYEAYEEFLSKVLIAKTDEKAVKRIQEGATETEGEWEDMGQEIFGDSD